MAPETTGGYDKKPLFRQPLSQQIADRLRNEIIRGEIKPGTHLVQGDLCARFDTSRMPVRDALQQLTHEGLLEENAGTRAVVHLGKEDLRDANELIAVLHGWAARRAAEHASDEELVDLEARLGIALDAKDSFEFSRAAWDFHRQINVLARSPRLLRALALTQKTTPRAFPLSLPNEMDATKRSYRILMQALKAREIDKAESVAREFSLSLASWMLALIDSHAEPGAID